MLYRSRFQILAIFVLILHLLSGCEFHPDEVPINKISPPQSGVNPISFTLDNYTDTIRLGWLTEFHYNISGTTNKIISVAVLFEGKEIYHYTTENKKSFSFLLDPASYSNGYYSLNIDIITSTGTGSIADKTGAEGLLYSLDLPVYIDKTMPQGTAYYKIKATRSSKGIELSWPSFIYPNFASYEIYRQVIPFQESVITAIMNPWITSYTDTTFWEGQSSTYWLGIQTPAGLFKGENTVVDNPLTGLQAKWNTDGTVDVKWDKTKNLYSFSRYYLYAGFNYSSFINESNIGNPDQNFIKLNNVGFGDGLKIFLKFIPKEVSSNDVSKLRYTKVALNPPQMVPLHSNSYNVNGKDFLLLTSLNKVYRYFPYDVRTEDSISIMIEPSCPLSVSNNGEKLVYYSAGIFYLRRTLDFTLENTFPGPPLVPNYTYIENYSLSDNGKMLVITSDGISYLYNIVTGDVLRKDTLMVDGYPVITGLLSPDGNRLVAQTYINPGTAVFYTLELDGWKDVLRRPVDRDLVFYSNDGAYVYLGASSNLETRSAADFSHISDYQFLGGYFQNIDLRNNRFLWSTVSGLTNVFVDLKTGLEIRRLDIANTGSSRLFDNYLVGFWGLQLTLPEFN